MKLHTLCFALLLLCPALQAATVTIQGAQTSQVIDGFGVNANYQSWNNDELKPVLDAFIDQAGMTLFRVVHDLSDWEASNDNSDPYLMNWAYYTSLYSSTDFAKLWDMFAYLNNRGITNGASFDFMGWGPAWMVNSSTHYLNPGMEEEWAEMIASLLVYARNTRGLQFSLVGPNNEPELYAEGVRMNVTTYTNALHRLALKLDTNGLSDLRFVAPDCSQGGTTYMPQMIADPVIMAKLKHFGIHSYGGAGSGSAGVLSFIQSSPYPDRTFWMTEFNVPCSGCDTGSKGTYDWTYCRGTADYLLNHLLNGASAGLVWEGYDSIYAHHSYNWSFWGLFSVDNQNAAVKTYTARKNFYTVSQISKFVRPGAQRIGVSGSTSPFSPLLAFKHTGLGQITIVGINTSSSAATLNGTLASLPSVTRLELYYTSQTTNLAHGNSVAVNNGTFSTSIPADCVFTLVGFTGVNVAITNPINGAQFNAPATIPIAATAATTAGSIALVGFYNGTDWLSDDTLPPYETTWNNVPMGDYSLTALAGDTLGNIGTSAVVNVAVAGPIAQIGVTPTSATLSPGATQQFAATGADLFGHTLNPQPAFSWSATGGGTIDGTGLFTAGNLAGGPFDVVASSGGIFGTGTVSVAAITEGTTSGGTIGNTNEGTSTDGIWDNGAWINANRFRATNNLSVTTMFAKIVAMPGKYKCAIYTDNNGQPNRLLSGTAEVSNPATGWQSFPLTSSVALTNGSYYWLAVWSDNATARIYYSGNNGTLRWGRYNYGSWPDPISTTGGSSFSYCIYASGLSAPTLTSMTVTPANPSIVVGGTQQFAATGTYSDGSTQNITSLAMWVSSNAVVANVNTSGLATGASAGATTISATLAGVTGSALLAVQALPTLSLIAVTPSESKHLDRRHAAIRGDGNLFGRQHTEHYQSGDLDFVQRGGGERQCQRTGHRSFQRHSDYFGNTERPDRQHDFDGASSALGHHHDFPVQRNGRCGRTQRWLRPAVGPHPTGGRFPADRCRQG